MYCAAQMEIIAHEAKSNGVPTAAGWQLLTSKLPHEKYCYG